MNPVQYDILMKIHKVGYYDSFDTETGDKIIFKMSIMSISNGKRCYNIITGQLGDNKY